MKVENGVIISCFMVLCLTCMRRLVLVSFQNSPGDRVCCLNLSTLASLFSIREAEIFLDKFIHYMHLRALCCAVRTSLERVKGGTERF